MSPEIDEGGQVVVDLWGPRRGGSVKLGAADGRMKS